MYALPGGRKGRVEDEYYRSNAANCDMNIAVNGIDGSGFVPYGRIGVATGPGSRSFAVRLANSHSSGRVSRGSMISSTRNVSAVRNGER